VKAILPLATLAIGIGIGWLLKESPDAPAPLQTKSPGREQGPGSGSGTGAAIAKSSPDQDAGVASSKSHLRPPKEAALKTLDHTAAQLRDTFMNSIREQQEKRNEAQIAKLVEKLGLDAAQEAKLREFFKKKGEEMSVNVGDDGNSVRMHHKPSGDSLDSFLKDLLPDQQEAAYEEMKQTEQAQKVEAKALRDMASLTLAMELRPEQRDAVYAVLEAQAREEAEKGGAKGLEGMAMLPTMDLVTSSPGTESVIEFQSAGAGDEATEQALAEARQRRDAELEAKVNRMNGVLDERQLADYRSYLQQQPAMLLAR